jgi:hypothetical protein
MKIFICVLMAAVYALAGDVTGKWSGSAEMQRDGQPVTETVYFVLKQSGSDVTGTAGTSEYEQIAIQKGKLEANKFTFEVSTESGALYKVTLDVQGDTMKGVVTVDREGSSVAAKMSLKKRAD